MVNFKVSFEGKFKRFSTDLSKASFEYFCEKCRKVFAIQSESTMLLIFQERDKQLIIRNEVDFSITVLSNLHGSENRTFQFLIQIPEPSASSADGLLINNHDLGNLLEQGMNHPDSQQFFCSLPYPLPQLRLEEDALQFMSLQIVKKAKLIRRDQDNHQKPSFGDNQFTNSQYDCSLITPQSQIQSSSVKRQEMDSLITKFHLNIQNSFETSQNNLQRSFESAFDQLNQSFRHMTKTDVKPLVAEPRQIEQSMTFCSAYASLQKLNQYVLNIDNQQDLNDPEPILLLTNHPLNQQVSQLLSQNQTQQDNNDQSQFYDFNQTRN